MSEKEMLEVVRKHVKSKWFDKAAHDWWHIERVTNMALKINKYEKGDYFIVSLIALLHDVFDWKFYDEKNIAEDIIKLLEEIKIKKYMNKKQIDNLCDSIEKIGFKGSFKQTKLSLEAMIVQDADRLDAMGTMGIARTFAFGGKHGRCIYDPEQGIVEITSEEHYKDITSRSSINHFYEKLLKLKDNLNTETGKRIAIKRHNYMENYLKRFFLEWDAKDIK